MAVVAVLVEARGSKNLWLVSSSTLFTIGFEVLPLPAALFPLITVLLLLVKLCTEDTVLRTGSSEFWPPATIMSTEHWFYPPKRPPLMVISDQKLISPLLMYKNVHATWYENVNHLVYETVIYLMHIRDRLIRQKSHWHRRNCFDINVWQNDTNIK